MANLLRIYSGPGQIVLWDATNGYFYPGFLQEIKLSEEPVQHELMDGNLHQTLNVWKLEVPLLQTDAALISVLNARRGIKQKIYVTGLEAHWTLDNVFITVQMVRGFNSGEAHRFVLTAQTAVESDYAMFENILQSDGKFETDSDSNGYADGWGGTAQTKSIVSSFLSGGGNAQKVTWDATADHYIETTARNVPFDSSAMPVKLTFSAYVLNNDAANSTSFYPTIFTYDKDSVLLSTHKSTETLSAAEQRRVSVKAVIQVASPVKEIRARIWKFGSTPADITIDNAQLEVGELTDFKAE